MAGFLGLTVLLGGLMHVLSCSCPGYGLGILPSIGIWIKVADEGHMGDLRI